VAWTLANRGSQYWQENWETKVHEAEQAVVGELFRKPEARERKGVFSGYRFSVSRIAIAESEFTVLVWIAILLREGWLAFGPTGSLLDRRWTFGVSVALTAAYCVLIVAGTLPIPAPHHLKRQRHQQRIGRSDEAS